MRVDSQRSTSAVVRTDPLPVEPWMKKQVDASFQRVKTAILTGNFSAYLAELHPEILKQRKVEDLAIHFGELKQAGVRDWEMDTLQRDQDGVGAKIKNAPESTIVIFAFAGKDQLKLGYLGEFKFS